jgi:HPt (histidine-containing phosphotransfer) domain-containing protein
MTAVVTYFGGDQALFDEFLSACKAQFPNDLAMGTAASQAGNWPALRRNAHNLKSVLLTLGYSALSEQAAACEALSAQGNAALAQPSWSDLYAGMVAAFEL